MSWTATHCLTLACVVLALLNWTPRTDLPLLRHLARTALFDVMAKTWDLEPLPAERNGEWPRRPPLDPPELCRVMFGFRYKSPRIV